MMLRLKSFRVVERTKNYSNQFYGKYGKAFCPLLVLIAYSFLGAVLFMLFERPHDQARRSHLLEQFDYAQREYRNTMHKLYNRSEAVNPRERRAQALRRKSEELRAASVLQARLLLIVLRVAIANWTIVDYNYTFAASGEYYQAQLVERVEELYIERDMLVERKLEDVDKAIDWFKEVTGLATFQRRHLGPSPWNLWGSVFYAGTIYTTIGYGHLAAETVAGRICTIFYALIGVPLFLTILNDIGKLMSKMLKTIWICGNQLAEKFRKAEKLAKLRKLFRRKKSDTLRPTPTPVTVNIIDTSRKVSSNSNKQSDIKKEEKVDETGLPERRHYHVPVWVAVGLLIFWMFACGGIFYAHEDEWSYFTAVYFFFISLTTIGLGDIIPTHIEFLLMNFLLVLVGLAIVSMCFNIIQAKIEYLIEQMVAELQQKYYGYFEEDDIDEEDSEEELSDDEIGPLSIDRKASMASRRRSRRMTMTPKIQIDDLNPLQAMLMPLRQQFNPRPRRPSLRPDGFDLDGAVRPSLGVMQLGNGGLKQRLLMQAIGDHQRNVLKTAIEKRVRMRNAAVQTELHAAELERVSLYFTAPSEASTDEKEQFSDAPEPAAMKQNRHVQRAMKRSRSVSESATYNREPSVNADPVSSASERSFIAAPRSSVAQVLESFRHKIKLLDARRYKFSLPEEVGIFTFASEPKRKASLLEDLVEVDGEDSTDETPLVPRQQSDDTTLGEASDERSTDSSSVKKLRLSNVGVQRFGKHLLSNNVGRRPSTDRQRRAFLEANKFLRNIHRMGPEETQSAIVRSMKEDGDKSQRESSV